jgi:hypothetical protein
MKPLQKSYARPPQDNEGGASNQGTVEYPAFDELACVAANVDTVLDFTPPAEVLRRGQND